MENLHDFFYNAYVIEVFGGIILSIMGLTIVWFLRPKVIIAPKIAVAIVDGKKQYSIKVINKSYIFRLIDLNFELTMLRPIASPKGRNLALKTVNLKSNKLWFLSRREVFKKQNGFATYAIIVKVQEDFDLVEKWKEGPDGFLNFKVIAKNNFSGITSVTHEQYNHYSCVIDGVYEHGNSCKIVPV